MHNQEWQLCHPQATQDEKKKKVIIYTEPVHSSLYDSFQIIFISFRPLIHS